MGVVMTTNSPHSDPDPNITLTYEILKEILQEHQRMQPTLYDQDQKIILDITDRVIELENKIIELEKRIDWMENYDKKNSNNSANDDSV